MYDARSCVVALALVCAGWGEALAQPAPADLAAQRARVDSLRQEYERLVARRDSAAAERKARTAADLTADMREMRDNGVPLGPILLIGRPGTVARLRPAAEAIWRAHAPLVGPLSPRLGGIVLVAQETGRAEVVDALLREPRHHPVRLMYGYENRPEAALLHALAGVYSTALPAGLRRWLLDGDLAGDAVSTDRVVAAGAQLSAMWAPSGHERRRLSLQRAYREMVTSGSHAARRCHEGDVSGCRQALSLADPGPTWSGWYSPDVLREIAARRGGSQPARQACVRQHDDVACVEYFRRGPPPPPPLSDRARAAFLGHVLNSPAGPRLVAGILAAGDTVGSADGEAAGNVARSADDPGSAGHAEVRALLAASDEALDALVLGWRAEVLAHRPLPHADATRTRLTSLFWFALIGLLATGSTRWRLG
jgi:hypothetical protein